MRDHRRLGLGSAQFGMNYGVSNRGGQTPADEVKRILAAAAHARVGYLDTAPRYGSERVLGEAGPGAFRIVTKIDAGHDPVESVKMSLAALNVAKLHGVLFHHAADLQAPGTLEKIQELRATRLVDRIGVSVYHEREIDQLFAKFPLDLVQVPFNLFDQRLQESGALARLKKRGVEIHARSIFLQGALLMKPDELPPALQAARRPLADFLAWCTEKHTTPLAACLAFAHSERALDAILVGVNDVAQLTQILTVPHPAADWRRFALHDEGVLDPSTWHQKKSA